MVRKILKNNSKSKRLNGVKENKIGRETNIRDKNNNVIKIGDRLKHTNGTGIFLYNPSMKAYGIYLEEYNYDKFIWIPMDNGERMRLEIL